MLICPLRVLKEYLRSVKCPLFPVLQHHVGTAAFCKLYGDFYDLKCCNYEIADYVLAVL